MREQEGAQVAQARDAGGQRLQAVKAQVQVGQAGQAAQAGGQRGQRAPQAGAQRVPVLPTFEDQGAEVRQAPRHLSQGGPQQPGVFVGTQLQELHPQLLRGVPGAQAQQPAAAPGVQVQAQAVPGQEKGCPRTRIRIRIRSVCSILCSSRPGLRLLLRRGHRPPAGLGGRTCPSLPGRPAQAGPGGCGVRVRRGEEWGWTLLPVSGMRTLV